MSISNQGSNRVGRYVAWGLLGLIILVGASIATSIIFFAPRSSGTFYPVFPFFPFHFGILGVIFLIFILFWIARWLLFGPWKGRYHAGYHEDDAHEILRERYAKGEITKEQFEQMIRDLRLHD
jgi:putative membrane protein